MTWATAVRLGLLLLAGCPAAPAPDPPPAPGAFDDARRVVATLDDLAGEYPRAVRAGAVTDATRMRVLARQLHHVRGFAERFPADEQEALHAIEASVAARADPAGVVAAAHALRAQLLDRHQLVLGPGAPPPRARAEKMFGLLCAGCHGRTGAGDGNQGLYLWPEPKDFQDPDILATLSPSRAFSWISDGVPGTAMPGFGLFTRAERWALASLVFSFRHDPDEIDRGRALLAGSDLPRTPRALADRTDGDLLAELAGRGLDPGQAGDALAFLRAEAAFTLPPGPLAEVRHRLADALTGYLAGDRTLAAAGAAAARTALQASLPTIRFADRALAHRLDQAVARIGRDIDASVLTDDLDRDVARADELVDRGEAALRDPELHALPVWVAGALPLAVVALVTLRRRRG
jgi:high-affinity iron transporter